LSLPIDVQQFLACGGDNQMGEKQCYQLHFKVVGSENGLPVLLIHGLGCNMIDWSPDFIKILVKRGCRVILIDNRDAGKSPRQNAAGRPNLIWPSLINSLGLPDIFMPKPLYTLSDMATDSVQVLQSLGLQAAHIVGVSMGGMIGQRIAIEHPPFALSLTSIMSSSGAPKLPNPKREVSRMLMTKRSSDADEANAQALAFRNLIAGRMIDSDADELKRRVADAFRYGSPHGDGGERQYAAILADRTRYKEITSIACRTSVVHGRVDPFVLPEHGRDSARRIKEAAYFEIDGMGHEIIASNAGLNAKIVLQTIDAA
jgi:pimeloyl-ACP methyl ester carboxylesterase